MGGAQRQKQFTYTATNGASRLTRVTTPMGKVTRYDYTFRGDPAALGILTMTADNVIDNCLTPANHPWPRFFISSSKSLVVPQRPVLMRTVGIPKGRR